MQAKPPLVADLFLPPIPLIAQHTRRGDLEFYFGHFLHDILVVTTNWVLGFAFSCDLLHVHDISLVFLARQV